MKAIRRWLAPLQNRLGPYEAGPILVHVLQELPGLHDPGLRDLGDEALRIPRKVQVRVCLREEDLGHGVLVASTADAHNESGSAPCRVRA